MRWVALGLVTIAACGSPSATPTSTPTPTLQGGEVANYHPTDEQIAYGIMAASAMKQSRYLTLGNTVAVYQSDGTLHPRAGMLRRALPLRSLICCLLLVPTLAAVDRDVPPGPQAPQPPPAPPPPAELLGWSHQFHPGFFLTSVFVSSDAEDSPDPTLQGSASSLAYRGVFDGALGWRSETSAFDQTLHLAYGQVKQPDVGWQENIDELRYEGVYRHDIVKPTFAYRSWGTETVFTNLDEDAAFDPIRVYASWGVGQLYRDFFPGDALEWRLGIRLQKSWGSSLTESQEDWQFGPETRIRYERTIDDLRSFFAMYEGWSEFEDMGHVTNIITAGLKMRFSTYVAVELGLRMYYEATPDDAGPEDDGYSQWFIRQDAMIGLDAVF